MVKLYALLVPREGMDAVAFHEHWIHTHGPLAGKIRNLISYSQAHQLPGMPDDLRLEPFGGCAQIVWEDLEQANTLMTDPDYTENAAHDEDNFHYMERMGVLRGTPRALLEGPTIRRDTASVMLVQVVKRRAGTDPAEFRESWLADDPADALAPELRAFRHVRAAAVAEDYTDEGEPGFDGARELHFADIWTLLAARARTEEWERLLAGPDHDPDSGGLLATVETRVSWPLD